MAAVFSGTATAADDGDDDVEFFKCLVKEKRVHCFRRLGGGAGIAAKLASHAERGIRGDGPDVRRRKEKYGENTYQYQKPKLKSFLRHVLVALNDVFLIALLICAVLSLVFGIKERGLKDGWYDGVSIFLAVLILSGLNAFTSHSQAKQEDKIASESANISVTVVRADRRQEVSIFHVVVGDVVILNIGDTVAADGVLLKGYGLQVDESGLTGEPQPIEIDAENNPFLECGVKVVGGHGSMLVTAVGADTMWAEMMNSISTSSDDHTPLQERIDALASAIGKIGVAVSMVVFTVLTARHFTGSTGKPPLLDKGIPLALALMLTFSVKRMVKDNAMVNRLSALETMGSATVICADKTGTLTLNQMKVSEFWVGTTDQPRAATTTDAGVVSLLCQGVGLNTTGSLYWPDNVSPPEICGSPEEKALLSWAVTSVGMDANSLKRRCKVVHVEAFSSDKKFSGVITRENNTGAVVAHRKGNAEMILANCSMYVDIDGASSELGFEQRKKLEKVINDMAVRGLRCIAFAYKQVYGDLSNIDDEGLTLLGLVGLKELCRPEVNDAIKACTKAGVAVKMVTGDSILTARAIAKECGILSSDDPEGVVIEGHEFRAMPRVRQLEVVDKIRVMASSQPLDKLVLVQRLKQRGHVVAVSGDGTNDAPALKEADVGLSMGIQGTEVAKESSDIIVLDDNFYMVTTAIRWGRCVHSNIRKSIQFHLTVNIAALAVNFVSAITMGNTPLTTAQLMWVNVAMGAVSALALAVDRPTEVLMNRLPIARTAPLISKAMWRNIAAQAAFQIAVLLALQHLGKANDTMIFNTFVLCQVFNEFNVRDIEKKNVLAGVLEKNGMFLVMVAVTLLLQLLMVEVLTRFAGSERLSLGQWGVCIAVAAVSWPIGCAVKFIPVPVEHAAHATDPGPEHAAHATDPGPRPGTVSHIL